jgi:hypothetical protein
MSLKEEVNTDASHHPNPIDRNRSIVWARYHVDSNEWALLSVKLTRQGQAPSLATVALVDHNGRTLVEEMIKASDMVQNEEIAQHAVDQSVVFNAKSFESAMRNLVDKIGDKTLVAWDMSFIQKSFDELCALNGMPSVEWKGDSASKELARFVGETEDPENGYKLQPLPIVGLSAVDECKAILKVINEIAGASQAGDSIATGKPGWTAEFYRPKVGAKEKLKGLFGLNS